jgi:hypothetical protein
VVFGISEMVNCGEMLLPPAPVPAYLIGIVPPSEYDAEFIVKLVALTETVVVLKELLAFPSLTVKPTK